MPEYNLYQFDSVLKKIYDRLDKVECCCASTNGANIGLGEGIFYKKNKYNIFQFKSLIAGDNISLVSTNNSITINSIGSTVDCQNIKDCIGIDSLGAPNKYLNEQGNFVTVSGSGFSCSDLSTCSTTNLPEGTNLYYTSLRAITALTGQNISIFANDSGYITSSSLTPYLTIASAVSTYQPIGTYATATNSMNFTNKTGNISQWANDSGYITASALSPYLLSSIASSTYEPIITPGTTAQYWRGDKTWQPFPTITSGTVTSVSMTTPTGLDITGSPITTSGTLGLTFTSGYSIPTISSQTNWDTAYTNRITSLTTTGTSGAATLIGNTLNIPQYSGGGSGTVTNVSALTLGTTGTDLSSSVANSTTTPVITLNVPTASAINRGVLSSTDWSTFNNKLDTSTGLYYINRATSGFTTITGAGSGISYSYEIPAGTMIIGDIATTDLFVDRTGGTGNMTIRFYFNTTNSISGAILAGTANYANTNLYAGITRTFSVESSTVTNAFNTGASASGDIPSGGASAMSVLNIDWSVPQWIIIHISMAGTGSATCKMFRMYK